MSAEPSPASSDPLPAAVLAEPAAASAKAAASSDAGVVLVTGATGYVGGRLVPRLLDAGYQRITLEAELPVDPVSPGQSAPTSSALAGLPATLRDTLIDQPKLPAEIVSVSAAPTANVMFTYAIGFKCTLPDNKQQLAGADLYVRGGEIIVAPDFDRLEGGLLSRSRENLIRLTVPAGALKPGQYHVILVGARASKAWTLQVH